MASRRVIKTKNDRLKIRDGQLPPRPLFSTSAAADGEPDRHDVAVKLHSLSEKNSMIVSVCPPLKPAKKICHVPCDIVLAIDVSGSMADAAPQPTANKTGNREDTGLSVLDLTKHATGTIIETLNKNDRLGVVAFSRNATVIHDLSYMTEANKKTALKRIRALKAQDCTNLWHGLRRALQILEDADSVPENIQALYILTDGQPNYMCPRQGYVMKLRQVLQDHQTLKGQLPTIHTFGFGYSIRSGLLQSIAEVGSGNYSFIPDAGMIGTVFVHAVANLYTTFATQAILRFRSTESLVLYEHEGTKTGLRLEGKPSNQDILSIKLGNLQYGQSRDILIHYDRKTKKSHVVQAKLIFNFQGSTRWTLSNEQITTEAASLPPHVSDYHYSRARICAFLRCVFFLNAEKEYLALPVAKLPPIKSKLDALIEDLKSQEHTDEQNVSLLQDLAGEEPHGQVSLAISKQKYYRKWGQHYLLSLLNAHTYQICNTFKDPGPLQYGKDSPLFCSCRRELDNCFDNLPAPKPSNPAIFNNCRRVPCFRPISMVLYNRSCHPCFAGHCKVRLPKGRDCIAIRDLRAGMTVWTPSGTRHVKAIVATAVRDIVLCNIGSLWITPWHPIRMDGRWLFPWKVSKECIPFSGTIYSVLLAPSPDPDTHAIMVGDHVCVSLGHGIQAGRDVRAHRFFGSYRRIVRSLNLLPRDPNGVLRCCGINRHPKTGLARAFVGHGRLARPIYRAKLNRRGSSGPLLGAPVKAAAVCPQT